MHPSSIGGAKVLNLYVVRGGGLIILSPPRRGSITITIPQRGRWTDTRSPFSLALLFFSISRRVEHNPTYLGWEKGCRPLQQTSTYIYTCEVKRVEKIAAARFSSEIAGTKKSCLTDHHPFQSSSFSSFLHPFRAFERWPSFSNGYMQMEEERRERGRLIKGEVNDGVCPVPFLHAPSTLTRVNAESFRVDF